MSVRSPSSPQLSPAQVRETSAETLAHYETHARGFWLGTRDHDVSQNIATLLRHLSSGDPQTILDLGCGPGRDLIAFRELGHHPVGLDGAASFVEMAREHAGCEVLHQDMVALDLPDQRFDGVFANAALFHVPGQELPRVLAELYACLIPGGVLFSSNPRGPNREGWSGRRYSCFWDLDTWRRFVTGAGFVELEHYYRPTGKPRAQQPWLATAWRRPDH